MSNKEAALRSMEEEHGHLLEAVEGLDDAQLSRIWLDGWSAKDILAHIAGWERVETEFLRRMARGERPNPEGTDYAADADKWNARFAAEMAAISPQTVIAVLRQAHMNHAIAARSLPEERYAEGKTAGRLIGEDARHYEEHAGQIRKWRESEDL